MSRVLPMETLPHWPEVADPSVLQFIGVVLGIPILVSLIIVVLNYVPRLMRMARGGSRVGSGAFWINPGNVRTVGIDTDEDSLPYTMGEREDLVRAVRGAEQVSGLDLSVYLGPAETQSPEDFAIDLLDSLPDPERSLLIHWDPATAQLEFVTGDETDRVLSAADLERARAEVETSAEVDKPVDGLVRAIEMLAASAGQPEVVQSDRPLAVNA